MPSKREDPRTRSPVSLADLENRTSPRQPGKLSDSHRKFPNVHWNRRLLLAVLAGLAALGIAAAVSMALSSGDKQAAKPAVTKKATAPKVMPRVNTPSAKPTATKPKKHSTAKPKAKPVVRHQVKAKAKKAKPVVRHQVKVKLKVRHTAPVTKPVVRTAPVVRSAPVHVYVPSRPVVRAAPKPVVKAPAPKPKPTTTTAKPKPKTVPTVTLPQLPTP